MKNNGHVKNSTTFNCANLCRYFKDRHLNVVVLLDFASEKTELLILSLGGGATCVINLFNIELTDVFGKKPC